MNNLLKSLCSEVGKQDLAARIKIFLSFVSNIKQEKKDFEVSKGTHSFLVQVTGVNIQ